MKDNITYRFGDYLSSDIKDYVCYKNGLLFCGPLWDMDLSTGNVSVYHDEDKYRTYNNLPPFGDGSGDSASGVWAKQEWFAYLCECPFFMELAKEKYASLTPYIESLYAENGYMIIKGKRAKIIGRICMDQTMLDISGIPDVRIGDEVLVFGSGENGERTADDLAVCADTINYEVVCNISKRVPRFFVRHEKITEVMYKI